MTETSTDVKGRAAALAESWERASSGPIWHPPTCGCGAGAGMPIISMACAEADLMDFLMAAAKAQDDQAAAGALRERQRYGTFGDWLRWLPKADVPEASFKWMEERVQTFLQSLTSVHVPNVHAR